MSVSFTQLYIDGEWRPSSTGTIFEVHNPYTQDLVGTAASASAKDCQDAADAAQRALSMWENTPDTERRDMLLRASDIFSSDRYKERIRDAIQSETSAPDYMVPINMKGAVNALRGAAGQMISLKGETFNSATPGAQVVAHRKPIGVMYIFISRLALPASTDLRIIEQLCDGAVECTSHTDHAFYCHPTSVREHSCAEDLGDQSTHPSVMC